MKSAIFLLLIAFLGAVTCTTVGDLNVLVDKHLGTFPQKYPNLHMVLRQTQNDPRLKAFHPLCGTCEALLATILNQASLQSYATQLETKVCGQLPAQAQPQCQGVFTKYSAEVITYILGNFDAKDVCEDFELCANSTASSSVFQRRVSLNPCTQCKHSVSMLQSMFSRPSVRSDIQKFILDHVCSTVPIENYKSRCTIFGSAILPTIIRGAVAGLYSESSCRAIRAC